MMYSADSSSSSSVADMPRLSSTGFRARPAVFSSEKFCMLRAPIWMQSAYWSTSVERLVVDRLGDDRQVELLADARQNLQPLLAQSLERVGRGARLVGAAAEELAAGVLDALGDGARLVERLDRARTADDDDAVAADVDAADVDDRCRPASPRG